MRCLTVEKHYPLAVAAVAAGVSAANGFELGPHGPQLLGASVVLGSLAGWQSRRCGG